VFNRTVHLYDLSENRMMLMVISKKSDILLDVRRVCTIVHQTVGEWAYIIRLASVTRRLSQDGVCWRVADHESGWATWLSYLVQLGTRPAWSSVSLASKQHVDSWLSANDNRIHSITTKLTLFAAILPARRHAIARYLLCPSVRPSVCLSQVGVLLRRLNLGSRKTNFVCR